MSEIITQIEGHMRALNLRAMIEVYRELGERATKGKLQYEEYLALLLEEEVSRKTEGSIKAKIAKAKFPFQKTIEEFDFSFQPSLNDREVIKLCSLDFIEQKGNVSFLGPPGVGKTHLSIGLGIKACMGKYRVLFQTAQSLIEELMLAKKDGSLVGLLMSYSRLPLLVIDRLVHHARIFYINGGSYRIKDKLKRAN